VSHSAKSKPRWGFLTWATSAATALTSTRCFYPPWGFSADVCDSCRFVGFSLVFVGSARLSQPPLYIHIRPQSRLWDAILLAGHYTDVVESAPFFALVRRLCCLSEGSAGAYLPTTIDVVAVGSPLVGALRGHPPPPAALPLAARRTAASPIVNAEY